MTTATATHGIEVGEVLAGTWGYEQTNASFFEVLKVTKSTVTLRELDTIRTEELPLAMCGTTTPVHGSYREQPITRKIHQDPRMYGGEAFVRVESYMAVTKWDGKPVRTSWYG